MITTKSSEVTTESAQLMPFLKWAGGKRWLTYRELPILKLASGQRYVEPFLGSGAMFFHLAPKKALLNDFNKDLVDTYRAIHKDWKAVAKMLHKHQQQHCDDYYYQMRKLQPRGLIQRAARFIYLNRTCFNGLYRVNRKGEFNVPRGSKNTVVMETDDFERVSLRLKGATLTNGDFAKIIRSCGKGDFIYADPPYTVKHNHNGFIKYNEQLFSWGDQVRLKEELFAAVDRGAVAIVSNADHPSINELYVDADCQVAERYSVMASESAKRKKTTELLIKIGAR